MKRSKTFSFFILLLLFCLVSIYAYKVYLVSLDKKEVPSDSLFEGLEENSFSSLSVKIDNNSYALKKENEGYVLDSQLLNQSPLSKNLDWSKFERVFGVFKASKILASFYVKPEELSTYGLDRSGEFVELSYADKKSKLILGNSIKISSTRYAMFETSRVGEGEIEVVVIEEALVSMLNENINYFRDRHAFSSLSRAQISEVVIYSLLPPYQSTILSPDNIKIGDLLGLEVVDYFQAEAISEKHRLLCDIKLKDQSVYSVFVHFDTEIEKDFAFRESDEPFVLLVKHAGLSEEVIVYSSFLRSLYSDLFNSSSDA